MNRHQILHACGPHKCGPHKCIIQNTVSLALKVSPDSCLIASISNRITNAQHHLHQHHLHQHHSSISNTQSVSATLQHQQGHKLELHHLKDIPLSVHELSDRIIGPIQLHGLCASCQSCLFLVNCLCSVWPYRSNHCNLYAAVSGRGV